MILPVGIAFADIQKDRPKFCAKPQKEAPKSFALGYESLSSEVSPSYNTPASIELNKNWEFFSSFSFLYWLADEEGLDLAMSASLIADEVSVPPVSVALFQEVAYKPGFKIGIGVDTRHDDWLTGLEYTWVRQSTHISENAPGAPIGVGIWFISNWFIQPNASGQTVSATSVSSKWHLGMDLLDAYLERPFYQGRSLTIAPFAALRAVWIRQSLRIQAADPLAPFPFIVSHNHSNSWGLGPRMGIEGHWLMGYGIRLESDLAASVLYTRYTSVNHSEDPSSSNTIPVAAVFSNYGCVRSITEISLGLGWGRYFHNNKAAIDLLASYDFSVFWNQNMMRMLVDLNTLQEAASASNLYLHGLTVTLRLNY